MSSAVPSRNYNAVEETGNQGIVDGRQAGSNPEPAPTRLDTYVDRDATRSSTTHASDTLNGSTSQDVHRGIGQPLGGQTSHEEHTNGMHGRKRDAQGVSQFGPPGDREQVLGREERDSQKFGDRVA
ncbi:uncharacterized protein SCHCODRAFT_02624624 [Schizophyllum commune H4-8]|uniref:Uncharacterized protein n=1 Tax=Schizophyllum commune (strain H4-8 / FGSC 9210) TaxID=578458 RepID=D8PLW8_SCHCM|nr:uncharacterized protein SCHCODRAFT_02624624 [Schizophyllum commune H4-8]KAI5894423.1 hypothetical protein SCHCODRAFT_02624624 [Schizophyllum commune H4-8]